MGLGHCITGQQHWTLQLLWALHQWTTTWDIAAIDKNKKKWWGKEKKERERERERGEREILGHCITGQQHWTLQLLWTLHQWTTTFDIAAIRQKNNNKKKRKRE